MSVRNDATILAEVREVEEILGRRPSSTSRWLTRGPQDPFAFPEEEETEEIFITIDDEPDLIEQESTTEKETAIRVVVGIPVAPPKRKQLPEGTVLSGLTVDLVLD